MNIRQLTLFLCLFLLLSSAVSAQGGGPPPPGLPDDTPTIAIDSHGSILFAAGVILGFAVFFSQRKS